MLRLFVAGTRIADRTGAGHPAPVDHNAAMIDIMYAAVYICFILSAMHVFGCDGAKEL
jgi:hypothetical protein